MKYLEFYQELKAFKVFSISDVRLIFPNFDNRRLVEWQQKKYISKIIKGYYYFNDNEPDEIFVNKVANRIYNPSYISMENALSYYGFIPEGVFASTSVTTRNTAKFDTPLGLFDYKHIKSNLFFGYKLIQKNGMVFKMAEPEKVILDFLYFRKINDIETMSAIRFNKNSVQEHINMLKLDNYLTVYDSAILQKRINLFKINIHA